MSIKSCTNHKAMVHPGTTVCPEKTKEEYTPFHAIALAALYIPMQSLKMAIGKSWRSPASINLR